VTRDWCNLPMTLIQVAHDIFVNEFAEFSFEGVYEDLFAKLEREVDECGRLLEKRHARVFAALYKTD
jgi:hypothetical protein